MIAGARIAFVVDGAIEQQTGGYLYDRIVVDGLRAAGAEVRVISLATDGWRAIVDGQRTTLAALHGAHDVVVIDELCHPRTVAAALVARARRSAPRPRVVTLVHHLAASERAGARRLARLGVERALLAASDRVVATSETTARLLAGLGVPRDALFVARPGRDRLGDATAPPLPGPHVRFLFLGALTRRKAPLAAIEAFSKLDGAARLTLVGPTDRDPRHTALVTRAAAARGDRVRLAGEVDDAEVTRMLGAHDVLLMPSCHEGYGIAAAEALAHGLVVIATAAGALPEVVRDGDGGVLVPPGDAGALARAVRRAASDPAWLAAQKERALARGKSLPTWADTVGAFAHAVLACA